MKHLFLTTAGLLAFTLPAQAQTYVDVNGLVCDFCAQSLKKVFSKEEAVQDIDVNLDTKVVTINYKDGASLDDERVRELITDSGYNVEAIRHGDGEAAVEASDGE